MGVGSGVRPELHAPEPPVNMNLGAPRCLHRVGAVGEATGCAAGAPEVEDIPRVPPHPWDTPARVSRTWLHRGDRVDIVEEEDVDPLIESLKNHISVVNGEVLIESLKLNCL